MLIYAIDDEPNMLYLLHEAIAEAASEAFSDVRCPERADFRTSTPRGEAAV